MNSVVLPLRDDQAQPAFQPGLRKPFPGLPSGAGAAETQRKKLWDLSPNLLCSIIGTCLSSDELRKIMQKCKGEGLSRLSEHDLHTEAVQTAAEKGDAAKLMNKALDRRHEAAIQRFDKAKTFEELLTLWNESKRRGDVAGAYWAGITHRKSDQEFIRIAFGDIHMLSHLVASTSRADIRRLAVLESEHSELRFKFDDLHARFDEAILAREEVLRKLDSIVVPPPASTPADAGEAANLLKEFQDKLSTEIARRERAEARLAPLQSELEHTQAELRSLQDREKELREELDAAEIQLGAPDPSESGTSKSLRGACILYVGGRAAQMQEIRAFVDRAGGEFLHHDGGIEHRRGLLAGMVSRAGAVFFPVDCISHDAAGALKRLCQQTGKPFYPLRTSSLTSFNAGLSCFLASVRLP